MRVDPKRILYVQPNNEVGGSDIALLRTIRELDRTHYAPVVVLPCDGPLSEHLLAVGAELHFAPMKQLRTLPSPRYQVSYLAQFAPAVRRIQHLIRRERIALVHTNSLYCLYGAWAARLANCPHIWHLREIPPAVPVLRPLYAQMVTRLSSLVVAMTTACVEGLFDPDQIPGKVEVMPDGIDVARWNPEISGHRIRNELRLPPDTPVIGFVARLDPWKGLEVFLQAAKLVSERVPSAHFLVVGDAPQGFEVYKQGMQSLANNLGLDGRVHFLGWRYQLDDIPEVMAALTVLCHTPLRPEPFGLVLIEAMAVGRPVVAPRAGGPADIVLDGTTGYLVPPSDVGSFADRLCLLVEDPSQAARMGTAARERVVDRYSSERFASRLAEMYSRVIPA
jgi:glycosyltransferase involved in cell wall biosynthesis